MRQKCCVHHNYIGTQIDRLPSCYPASGSHEAEVFLGGLPGVLVSFRYLARTGATPPSKGSAVPTCSRYRAIANFAPNTLRCALTSGPSARTWTTRYRRPEPGRRAQPNANLAGRLISSRTPGAYLSIAEMSLRISSACQLPLPWSGCMRAITAATARRPVYGREHAAARPDERERRAQARQAAEALFKPEPSAAFAQVAAIYGVDAGEIAKLFGKA
jgi:hypothetical protein